MATDVYFYLTFCINELNFRCLAAKNPRKLHQYVHNVKLTVQCAEPPFGGTRPCLRDVTLSDHLLNGLAQVSMGRP